jgi:hypothetical protein
MSSTKLIRWSGLSLMLGGIGIAIHFIIHPPGETAQYTLYPLWGLAHWLGGIAALLILFGLIGVFLHQSEKAGMLGLAGFVLAFVGTALYAGGQLIFGAMIQPFIAAQAPTWLDPGSPFAQVTRSALLSIYLPLLPGYLLLGIATLRAHMFPRLGSWLIILITPIGVLGLALIGSSFQGVFQILGGLVWGVGLLVWGYALWPEKGETVPQAKPAM